MSQREFKIGDKVIRIKDQHMGMYVGDMGTVKDLDFINGKLMGVMFNEFEGKHSISNLKLVEENVEENKMNGKDNKINNINEVMKKIFEVDNNSEVRDLEYNIRNCEENIKTGIEYINKNYKRMKEAMVRLKAIKEYKSERDFKNDINALLEHKYIENIEIDGDILNVYTDYIDIYDEDGNKFKGNKYRLEFDYRDMRCKIFGLDSDFNRRSYWSSEDPHPHVNGENGNACWGDAGSMLSCNMNEGEIYASFIVVLNFLQQVNTNDPAGEHIGNWDCINEDGEDIDNPYEPKGYEECEICHEEMDEDNYYHCDDCGRNVCGDHAHWVDDRHTYVCQICREANYTRCNSCEELFHDEDTYEVDDNYYCRHCRDEKFEYCDACEEWVDEDETFVCDDCGKCYCHSCSGDNEGLCDDCYEEEEEEDEE